MQKDRKHHLVPSETQTAGSLREHKDGGLLDRKALVLSLTVPGGAGGATYIVRQGSSGYLGKEVRRWKGKRKGKEKQERTVSLIKCQQHPTYNNAAY